MSLIKYELFTVQSQLFLILTHLLTYFFFLVKTPRGALTITSANARILVLPSNLNPPMDQHPRRILLPMDHANRAVNAMRALPRIVAKETNTVRKLVYLLNFSCDLYTA